MTAIRRKMGYQNQLAWRVPFGSCAGKHGLQICLYVGRQVVESGGKENHHICGNILYMGIF